MHQILNTECIYRRPREENKTCNSPEVIGHTPAVLLTWANRAKVFRSLASPSSPSSKKPTPKLSLYLAYFPLFLSLAPCLPVPSIPRPVLSSYPPSIVDPIFCLLYLTLFLLLEKYLLTFLTPVKSSIRSSSLLHGICNSHPSLPASLLSILVVDCD